MGFQRIAILHGASLLLVLSACGGRTIDSPDGSASTPFAAGANDAGDSGTTMPLDASHAQDAPQPQSAPECWQSALTEPQPKAPTHSTEEVCSAPGGSPTGSLANLVGRWVSCSAGLMGTSRNGLEIGGNSRWRLLTVENGEVSSASDDPLERGFISVMESSQVNFDRDGGGGFAWFANLGADGDGILFDTNMGPKVMMARIAAGPANGSDNLHSITGPCSMAGTWDVAPDGSGYGALPQTLSFDDKGRFVVLPAQADPCAAFTASGFWWSDSSVLAFERLTGPGVPSCQTDGGSSYASSWGQDGCDSFHLTLVIDSCTGGGLLRSGAILTRRK